MPSEPSAVPSDLEETRREQELDEQDRLASELLERRFEDLTRRGEPFKRRDLIDVVGTWVDDPEFEQAVAEQRRIDFDRWP